MKFTKSQIIMALGAFLLGMFALSAYQTNTLKLAVVNLGDVAEQSKLGQREKKDFEALRTKYGALIQFLNTNKVVAREDSSKIIDLWRKESPTAAETQQLETLKTKAQTQSDELRRLISVLNPSAEQSARIRELSGWSQTTEDILPQLDNMLGQSMQARAGAIDELIASGALEDASAIGQGDDIARELEAMSKESDVEAELTALKSGSSQPPSALEAGGDNGQAAPVQEERQKEEGQA